MIILLPPSEGKADGGTPRTSWNPGSGLLGKGLGPMRADVARALAAAKGGDQKLLGVKGDVLENARAANRTLVGSPTLPAWQRYTGVVWDHLDLASMTATARKTALAAIFVPSAVMGLVRADDPVPGYKLKMGVSIVPIGKVARFWKEALTAEMQKLSAKHVIVDLLPQEHAGAFDWSAVDNVVRVDLVSKNGGVVGGHNAKAAKGLLARHILDNVKVQSADAGAIRKAVSSFRHAEYGARVHRA
ncbi:MAG: hypothetical protein RJA47_898 [Actinomycetota bacterium]